MRHDGVLTIKLPYDEALILHYFRMPDRKSSEKIYFEPCVSPGDRVKEGMPIGYFISGTLSWRDPDYELPAVTAPTEGEVVSLSTESKALTAWGELIALDVGQSIPTKVIEETLTRKATAELYLYCQKKRFSTLRPMNWSSNPFGATFSVAYGIWYWAIGKLFDRTTKSIMDAKSFRWP